MVPEASTGSLAEAQRAVYSRNCFWHSLDPPPHSLSGFPNDTGRSPPAIVTDALDLSALLTNYPSDAACSSPDRGPTQHRSGARQEPVRAFSPNTVQLGARMVACGGPVGWGQVAWCARLTCHLTYLRLMTRGLERCLRTGFRRRQSRVMACRHPFSVP